MDKIQLNPPIKQHYVPQFLLRNFQIQNQKGKEKSIYVFDKSTEKEYQSPIKSTATERLYYEVKTENENFSIESKLEIFESKTNPIIQKIIQNKSIKCLTNNEKMTLTKFISLQHLRVPANRNRFTEFTDFFETELNLFETFGKMRPTQEEEKINHCEFILETISELSPYIYNKDWLLCESKEENYIIGDNPIVLHNTFEDSHRGLGLRSPGVEIYMPISPRYCILLVCNTVRKKINSLISDPKVRSSGEMEAKRLQEFADQLRKNKTITQSKDNVIFSNFLQTTHAERFEPYRVCRRVNILRDYSDEKTKLYPRN